MSKLFSNFSAIILSGGLGSRLGYKEKGLLKFEEEELIARRIRLLKKCFEKIIVVTNSPSIYKHLDPEVTLVQDEEKHSGPLMGLYCGLKASTTEMNFVSGVDMPYLNYDLLSYLAGFCREYDTVVAKLNGKIEPLFGFYSQKTLPQIAQRLKDKEHGGKRISALADLTKTKLISEEEIKRFDPDLVSFVNVNTYDDLVKLGLSLPPIEG